MNNPHEASWNNWLIGKAKPWFIEKRGRYAALARHLGVSRQTVSRWFHGHRWGKTPVPGWAAVALNIWVVKQWAAEKAVVTTQTGNRFQNLEFGFSHKAVVRRSADKLPVESAVSAEPVREVVTTQADEERRFVHVRRAA